MSVGIDVGHTVKFAARFVRAKKGGRKLNIYTIQEYQGYTKNDFDMHTGSKTTASGSKRGDQREGVVEDGNFRNEE